VSRQFALPYTTVPGDSSQASYSVTTVNEAGASVGDTLLGRNNDIGLGYTYLNTAYDLVRDTTAGAPVVNEAGFVLHDVYHPASSPLNAYFDGTLKRSTATNTSNVDPRASLVYSISSRDVVRLSGGATTTQPAGNQLDQPFVPSPPGGAGGGAAINCSSNSVGSAPSSVLKAERGVDAEVAYGHRFNDDSVAQLALYNVNIYDKLFSTTTFESVRDWLYQSGISRAGNSRHRCGLRRNRQRPGNRIGDGDLQCRSRARTRRYVTGRQRLARRTFVDYDYAIDSTALISAPVQLLKANVTLIPGAQLVHLPLQTFIGALDQVVGGNIDLRWNVYTFSSGNTKALPAYNLQRSASRRAGRPRPVLRHTEQRVQSVGEYCGSARAGRPAAAQSIRESLKLCIAARPCGDRTIRLTVPLDLLLTTRYSRVNVCEAPRNENTLHLAIRIRGGGRAAAVGAVAGAASDTLAWTHDLVPSRGEFTVSQMVLS
jgi:hypothetical protein